MKLAGILVGARGGLIGHSMWALAGLLVMAPSIVRAVEGDIPDAEDYDLVGRFEGSVITGYTDEGHDKYLLLKGPVKVGGDRSNAALIKGRVRFIAYSGPNGAIINEIYRDYRIKLQAAGFDILFKCYAEVCGGTNFSYSVPVLPTPRMTIDPANFRYLAARRQEGGREITVTVLVSHDAKGLPRTQVAVIESGSGNGKNGQDRLDIEPVDAGQMSRLLARDGHVALYGIVFDTDKADIRSESRPVLDELARFLKDRPGLRVILVGHTDNKGAYDHNMNLSDQRARAIVRKLVDDYGIKSSRLRSNGVGYLAPVASNDTEQGRALNRRVEMIKAP